MLVVEERIGEGFDRQARPDPVLVCRAECRLHLRQRQPSPPAGEEQVLVPSDRGGGVGTDTGHQFSEAGFRLRLDHEKVSDAFAEYSGRAVDLPVVAGVGTSGQCWGLHWRGFTSETASRPEQFSEGSYSVRLCVQ